MSDIALRCSVSLNRLRVFLLSDRSSTNRTERIATTDLHSVVVDVYRETIVTVYFGRTCEGSSKQELEDEFQIGCFVTRGYARHEKSTRITGKLLAGKRSLFALFRRKCTGSRTGSAIEQEYSAPSFCPFLSLFCVLCTSPLCSSFPGVKYSHRWFHEFRTWTRVCFSLVLRWKKFSKESVPSRYYH